MIVSQHRTKFSYEIQLHFQPESGYLSHAEQNIRLSFVSENERDKLIGVILTLRSMTEQIGKDIDGISIFYKRY